MRHVFAAHGTQDDDRASGRSKREWTGGYSDLGLLARDAAATAATCGIDALYSACTACQRFSRNDAWYGIGDFAPGARGGRGATSAAAAAAATAARTPPTPPPPPPPAAWASCTPGAGGACCGAWVPPAVLWQSWYHLFVPTWLSAGDRLLVAFSDELFDQPQRFMGMVASHFRLPTMQFDTRFAYNTRAKRGLKWRGRAAAVRREPRRGGGGRGGAAADSRDGTKPAGLGARANVSAETTRLLRLVTRHSTRHLDELLRAARRPRVPEAWLAD